MKQAFMPLEMFLISILIKASKKINLLNRLLISQMEEDQI